MTHSCRGIGAFRDFEFSEGLGRAAVDPPEPVIVGRPGRWRFTFTAGPSGIAAGGALRFTPPNGFSAPQFEDATAPGCCAFGCSRDGVRLSPSLWEPELGLTFLPASLTLALEGGALEGGDTITIDYGWTPSGIPGAHVQRLAMPAAFYFLVDVDGNENWKLLPDPPVIDVIPDIPQKLIAVSPAQVAAGRSFALRVVLRDVFENVAPEYRGAIRFSLEGASAALPPTYQMTPSDGGIAVIENFCLNSPGVFRIEVQAEGLLAAHLRRGSALAWQSRGRATPGRPRDDR